MRSWWILLVVLALVGGGAAVAFMGSSDPEELTTGDPETAQENEGRRQDAGGGKRTALTGARQDADGQPAKGDQPAKPKKKAKSAPGKEPAGRLFLEARDLTWQKVLRGTRWTVRPAEQPDAKSLIDSKPSLLEDQLLPVPLGVEFEVRVEVAGFVPAEPQRVTLTKEQSTKRLKFWMRHAAPFSGVELRVLRTDGKPAERLQVKAMLRQNNSWRRLWHRRKAEANGIYRLPELKPGRYRFECQVVDENSLPTYDLPFSKEVEFTGGSQHIVQHVCRLGGRIEAKVLGNDGKLVAEQVNVQLTARTLTGTRKLKSVWDQLPRKKEAEICLNCFSGGHAVLRMAVAPGQYSLLGARQDNSSRNSTEFPVLAGQTARVQLILR